MELRTCGGGRTILTLDSPYDHVLCNVDLSGKDLNNADFSDMHLIDVDLSNAKLWRASFKGAFLYNVKFSYATLCRANFSSSFIKNSIFNLAEVSDVDFGEATIMLSNFDRADLARSDFSDSVIRSSDMPGCNLSFARFDRAHMTSVSMSGANINRTEFSDVDLRDVDLRDVSFHNPSLLRALIASDRPIRRRPVIITSLAWQVIIDETHMRIGGGDICLSHTDWEKVSDEYLRAAPDRYPDLITFWKHNREFLLSVCQSYAKMTSEQIENGVPLI